MKKFFQTVIACTLVLILFACSKKTETTQENEEKGMISELLDAGYIQGLSQEDGNHDLKIEFYNEDHTDFKMAEVTLTDKQQEDYDSIDFFAEDYDQQVTDFLDQLDLKITSINDKAPSQDELDEYAGKTVADLEADGYEQCSFNKDSEGVEYIVFANDFYTIQIYPVGGTPALVDMPEDMGVFVIEKIGFLEFNDLLFEE